MALGRSLTTRSLARSLVFVFGSYTVVDSSEDSVFLHVNHGGAKSEWGNIYVSNAYVSRVAPTSSRRHRRLFVHEPANNNNNNINNNNNNNNNNNAVVLKK